MQGGEGIRACRQPQRDMRTSVLVRSVRAPQWEGWLLPSQLRYGFKLEQSATPPHKKAQMHGGSKVIKSTGKVAI